MNYKTPGEGIGNCVPSMGIVQESIRKLPLNAARKDFMQ